MFIQNIEEEIFKTDNVPLKDSVISKPYNPRTTGTGTSSNKPEEFVSSIEEVFDPSIAKYDIYALVGPITFSNLGRAIKTTLIIELTKQKIQCNTEFVLKNGHFINVKDIPHIKLGFSNMASGKANFFYMFANKSSDVSYDDLVNYMDSKLKLCSSIKLNQQKKKLGKIVHMIDLPTFCSFLD